MALTSRGTLPFVAKTKSVSPGVLAAFSSVLREWMDERHGGNQTHAARALGVSQSHISAMLIGARGPGLNTLILMREQTGKSLDQMLGLPPLATPLPLVATMDEAAVRRAVRAELESIQQAIGVTSAPRRKRSQR